MTEGEITAIIGIGVSFVTLVGGIIARDRYVLRLISTEIEKARAASKSETDALHERVNRVRDDYVKRVDLDSHIVRLDSNMQKLSEDVRNSANATNTRLDALMSHLLGKQSN